MGQWVNNISPASQTPPAARQAQGPEQPCSELPQGSVNPSALHRGSPSVSVCSPSCSNTIMQDLFCPRTRASLLVPHGGESPSGRGFVQLRDLVKSYQRKSRPYRKDGQGCCASGRVGKAAQYNDSRHQRLSQRGPATEQRKVPQYDYGFAPPAGKFDSGDLQLRPSPRGLAVTSFNPRHLSTGSYTALPGG